MNSVFWASNCEKYFIKLKKHCFTHQGFDWSYADCKYTLPFPFAVTFIIKKNVQAYILRLDYLLYAARRSTPAFCVDLPLVFP